MNRNQQLISIGSWAFPLNMLFRIMTGISLFCAVMTVSPELAIGITLFVTPALIRTTLVLDLYEQEKQTIDWSMRISTFLVSLAYAAVTSAIGLCVFVLICILCGFFGLVFSIMVQSQNQSESAIVVGGIIGMIWGLFGAILVMTYMAVKTWIPAYQEPGQA